MGRVDAQAYCGFIDPFCGAFEFGIVADGGFVDDAVALAVGPFRPPFFITEGGHKTERKENLGHSLAVGDLGLGLDAVLVGVFTGPRVGQALMGNAPAVGVASDAEDFSAGAHLAVGCVVEDVALEGARSLQGESGGFKTAGQAGEVVHAKFNLGFDGHRLQ